MRPSEQAEGLFLSYQSDENVTRVETVDENVFLDVDITDKTSVEYGVQLIGEDGAGNRVVFEILYDYDGGVLEVRVLRGRAESEYGHVKTVIVG